MVYRDRRKGVHKIPSMLEYKSPTTLEMPEVETFLIENPDPEGPFGAKEVGQGPLLPVMPGIANAVHDALGVRVDQSPITPELATFIGKPAGTEMARTDVTKEITAYVRAHNLQDKENGRKINPVDFFYSDLQPAEYVEFKRRAEQEGESMD